MTADRDFRAHTVHEDSSDLARCAQSAHGYRNLTWSAASRLAHITGAVNTPVIARYVVAFGRAGDPA